MAAVDTATAITAVSHAATIMGNNAAGGQYPALAEMTSVTQVQFG
ncbi:hypothetical protein [Hyphomicrobium sp.]|nr:hypothetical protein [Hyphomicrobium sp.]